MKTNNKYKSALIIVLLLMMSSMLSCKSQEDSSTTTIIKAERSTLELRIIELIKQADTPYFEHEAEIQQLVADIEMHYKDTLNIKGSDYVIEHWNVLLKDENESLLFTTYLKKWKQKGTLEAQEIQIGVANVRMVLKNIAMQEQKLLTANI